MLTAMLGYTLSRNELPGRKIINFLVFFTLLFNGGMVPTYLLYVNNLTINDFSNLRFNSLAWENAAAELLDLPPFCAR